MRKCFFVCGSGLFLLFQGLFSAGSGGLQGLEVGFCMFLSLWSCYIVLCFLFEIMFMLCLFLSVQAVFDYVLCLSCLVDTKIRRL